MSAKKKSAPTQAAPVAPVIPLLTKPNGAKSAKTSKLALPGHESLASQVRARAQQIETLEAEQAIDCGVLVGAAKTARRAAEVAGTFYRTVEVGTKEDKPVQVVFSDRYSDVDVAHEAALKAALGAQYEATFTRQAKVKARGDLTLAALKAVLGDKFEAFRGAFEVTEYLTPVTGFMETRANMRRALSDTVNATLDGIVDQVQYKPSVKTR